MNGIFNTTRWTLVRNAGGKSPEARAALSELCAAYYSPVVAFLRRDGRPEDAARELAHGFFEQVLGEGSLAGAMRGQGRFRSYVLGAVKHFLLRTRRDAARLKRGGEAEHVFLDDDDNSLEPADTTALPGDALFDREWALAIVERSLGLLQSEHAASGSLELFAALRPWLAPVGSPSSQSAIAVQLDMSEAAVKVAIHRVRKRFRELVRLEVAQTLHDPAELDDEMRHLVAVLV